MMKCIGTTLLCAIALSALSFADGFSTVPKAPSRYVGRTGTPTGPPYAPPVCHSHGRPGSALCMSETYLDGVEASTATTQQPGEAAPVRADADVRDFMPTQPNLMERLASKAGQIDMNEAVNTAFVAMLSLAVLCKLTMVDSGLTRGWTGEEVAARMAADNWSGYLSVLRNHPIATKAVTSATVYSIGDVLAQRSEGESMGSLDRPRILRSLLAGLIGHGPLSHFWYEISENVFDNVLQLTAWWSFIPKVAIDQTLWGPFWNNSYILLLGLMKRESLETIWGDVKRTTIPLVVSGLKLWPLAHCVTYGLIPVENRLLWVDMVEILWVTILATQAAGGGAETSAEATAEETAPVLSADGR